MKKLIFFGMFLICGAWAGAAGAQTAAQYTAAGNQSYAAKDFAKAAQYYQAAANMDPNSAAAFQGLGNSQYSLGQNNEAIASYEKALGLNPNNTALASFVQSLKAKVAASNNPAPAVNSPAAAYKTTSAGPKDFEICPMAGVAVGGGATGVGFGGHVSGFYMTDAHLGFGGTLGYLMFGYSEATTGVYTTQSFTSGTYTHHQSYNIGSIEIMPMVKYKFDGNGFKPYILGGAGAAMLMDSHSDTYDFKNGPAYYSSFYQNGSYPGGSAFFPMLQAGGGVEFAMKSDMAIFIEGKYSLLIGNGATASYIPIEAGVNIGI